MEITTPFKRQHKKMCLVGMVLAAASVCLAYYIFILTPGLDKTQAQPITAMAVTPNSGPITGGTEITITGDNIKPGNMAFKSASSSLYHTCAITQSDEVYCWGLGDNGQLGDGNLQSSSVPVRVLTSADDPDSALPGGVAIEYVAVGVDNTCVATSEDIYCWGSDTAGKLGNGGTTGRTTKPVKVFDATDNSQSALTTGGIITGLTAGAHHICAVKNSYDIYCWGEGMYGALGNNASISSSLPVRTRQGAIGSDVVYISAGAFHTCYSAANNEIWCWGYGSYGQIGDGTVYATSTVPYKVQTNADNANSQLPNNVDILALSSGYYHTCVLASDSAAYCWGRNLEGQLGLNNGTVMQQNPRARKVRDHVENPDSELPAGVNLVSLAAGKYHTCALGDDKNIYCWGRGTGGQLGNGTIYTRGTAVKVLNSVDDTRSALPEGVAIDFLVAGDFTCAATVSDGLYCWGVGGNGQMGNDTVVANNPWAVQSDTALSLTVVLSNAEGAAECAITELDGSGKWVKCTTSLHSAGLVNVIVNNGKHSVILSSKYLYGDSTGTTTNPPGAGTAVGVPNTGIY
jgi:alpha-tubulin suppressor-like RCC1 family protein